MPERPSATTHSTLWRRFGTSGASVNVMRLRQLRALRST
jgi:hypothetical protein